MPLGSPAEREQGPGSLVCSDHPSSSSSSRLGRGSGSAPSSSTGGACVSDVGKMQGREGKVRVFVVIGEVREGEID